MVSETHVAHLRDKPEQDLNRIISVVVDMEHIYTAMRCEQNPDPKKVYNYFFKVNHSFKTISNERNSFNLLTIDHF